MGPCLWHFGKGRKMDAFEKQLSSVMMNTYHALGKLERALLAASRVTDLSISEVHMLEAVAAIAAENETGGASISELSDWLEVSLPSITAAVNKLVQKGYVQKKKGILDGRVVRVSLTRPGRRAERAHQYFHRKMVRAVTSELSEDEKRAIIKGVGKMEAFLERNIDYYSGRQL